MWKYVLFAGVTGLGLWCMSLQNRILGTGFDEKGLLIGSNPELWLIWIVTGLYLAGALVFSLLLGEGTDCRTLFPACFFSGTASVVAGLVMLFSGINTMIPGHMIQAGCWSVAGCAMVAGGVCRLRGRKPLWWADMLIFGCYVTCLVLSYREWNTDPLIQAFAFHLLAMLVLMMFAMHRGRCAEGYPDRRKMVFFGLAGLYLSLVAIPGAETAGFYFASAVWCAGGMCELDKQAPAAPGEAQAP